MFRVTSKSQLVEWLSGVQIMLLAIALVGFGWWVRGQVGSVTRNQILDSNRIIAEQMGRLLTNIGSEQLVIGDAAWERFQSIVEETTLPNDGYLCIADADSGRLLCHPNIRQNPGLGSVRIDSTVARSLAQREFNIFADAVAHPSGEASTGLVESNSQTEIVSAAFLRNINGVLFVHQSESATRAAVARILTPVWVAGLTIGVILILVSCKFSTAIIKRFEHALMTINASLEDTVRQRTKSLMKTRDAVIFGLAKLAESRDCDTGEHLERISRYSTHLAKAHSKRCGGVDEQVVEMIGLASSLHDIGKVGVPDRVLLKPGKLDDEERIEIQKHPKIGADCLDEIERGLGDDGFLSLAREICAFHHEKWDGSGYPYGMSNSEIPMSARLVSLADVYDALRSKRPYKEPFSHDEACKIITEGMGSQFDPAVVQTFLKINRDFEAISEEYLRQRPDVQSIDVESVDAVLL